MQRPQQFFLVIVTAETEAQGTERVVVEIARRIEP